MASQGRSIPWRGTAATEAATARHTPLLCALALCAAFLVACSSGGPDTVQNVPPGGMTPPPTTPPPSNPPPTNPPPGSSGLDARPDNTTCLATVQPDLGTAIAAQRVFPNLSFTNPVLMIQAPGDSSRWFVLEQRGIVKVFANANDTSTVSTFIDLRASVHFQGEAGLLGMAFDPNFGSNGRVYLSYTADPTVSGAVLESRISRFTVSGGVLNPASEEILLTIAQPFLNHNGGNIVFGPDGYLYAGFGDGGSGGDPRGNGQNRSTLLGKLLRIDVSGAGPYMIPPSNPFAGGARCATGQAAGSATCPEIYAYGFRNPWRWSFDRASPSVDLWLADVGQGNWEEVDRIAPGGNYGWNIREGAHCYPPSQSSCPMTSNGAPLIDPVAEYSHSLGVSVTGGYVYRGSAIPSLVGRYVFGDFGSGRIFALIPGSDGTLQRTEVLSSGAQISSFAQDSNGELYYLDYAGGGVFKIVPGSGTPTNPVPKLLSQTGCVSSTDPTQPASGLIPYEPIVSFWSDGADKARWMALPNGTSIAVQPDGDWVFPNGTVLMKHFILNGQLVETRLLMRHTDTGNWGGYTYRWNDTHTDATLVSGGLIADVGGQNWVYPSEAQCLQCHTAAAGGSLGLETAQLNSSITYPATGRSANQLDTLETIGLFSSAISRMAALPNPFDDTQPLAARARAYLHVNCSHCHRPNGGTPVNLDLRYSTPIGSTNTCNATPASGDLGVAGAKVIAPGDAAHSVLYLRMSRRDANQMPPIATQLVDTAGAALLQAWINGMNASCE